MIEANKVSDLLINARALIEDEGNWCQKTGWVRYAGDYDGLGGPRPDQMCVTSAVRRAAYELEKTIGEKRTNFLKHRGVASLNTAASRANGKVGTRHGEAARYNDSHTHGETLALFDTAIAQAEREGD